METSEVFYYHSFTTHFKDCHEIRRGLHLFIVSPYELSSIPWPSSRFPRKPTTEYTEEAWGLRPTPIPFSFLLSVYSVYSVVDNHPVDPPKKRIASDCGLQLVVWEAGWPVQGIRGRTSPARRRFSSSLTYIAVAPGGLEPGDTQSTIAGSKLKFSRHQRLTPASHANSRAICPRRGERECKRATDQYLR